MTGVPQRRRFWTTVRSEVLDRGFGICLDARPLNTPSGRRLAVPTEGLAEAIVEEWQSVEAEIRPERLPLTRAANTALDRLPDHLDAVVDMIAAYGDTDLICYRAEHPPELVRRQAEAWDPWLEWSRLTLGAPLIAVAGVMHHPQPRRSLAALRAEVARRDAFALTGLHDLVTLAGSLVLGLAVAREAIGSSEAWDLSRLDEAWQAEQWGDDAEALTAAARKRADFLQAGRLLRLLAG